jgi:hypothetical protein
MIEQQVSVDITDKGGVFDITKQYQKFIYNGKEWSYIASGLVRDVFKSDCGKYVIKIPRNPNRIDHNILEFEAYRDAPEWCKKNVAVTELTKDNYVIQEYLKINPDAGNFFREIGIRISNGTLVIFDCDIFLDSQLKKPEFGFKYQQVFSKSLAFGEACLAARALPRELRVQQRAAVKKHFPNIDTQKFRGIGEDTYIDDVLVPFDIATECGFTNASRLDYEF